MSPKDTLSDKELVAIRKELHRHPELSHQEANTARRIQNWLNQTAPDRIYTSLGGHGLAAVYKGDLPGPAVLFRCELDALPITETGGTSYKSLNEGVGHLCGHDGHMATLLGLASAIGNNRPQRGRAILLFQPAEETGTGAALVIKDKAFQEIRPDYAFALHNLPGFEKHQLILADPVFSAGSTGLEIELSGKTSHAAEPENGINPALAVAEIISRFNEISRQAEIFDEYVLITIVQVVLGEKAFGTSAGHAIVRATLRALNDKDFQNLLSYAISETLRIGKNEGLKVNTNTTEEFPVTRNHNECTRMIRELGIANNWNIHILDKPFRWSEDFGHFNKLAKSALIGIGSGLEQPKLHHPDFDYPDEIIPTGVEVLYKIYDHILKDNFYHVNL